MLPVCDCSQVPARRTALAKQAIRSHHLESVQNTPLFLGQEVQVNKAVLTYRTFNISHIPP
ncbi:hypothetical protein NOF04DRAFT_1327315 [Fusarium oxysporum II5]|nr:hypothetical protein NOF04DRAFT_1327315 [Fusarium oxysporum II5]